MAGVEGLEGRQKKFNFFIFLCLQVGRRFCKLLYSHYVSCYLIGHQCRFVFACIKAALVFGPAAERGDCF